MSFGSLSFVQLFSVLSAPDPSLSILDLDLVLSTAVAQPPRLIAAISDGSVVVLQLSTLETTPISIETLTGEACLNFCNESMLRHPVLINALFSDRRIIYSAEFE